MKLDLTEDEVTTVMVALDNYRDLMSDRFLWSGDDADQQEEGSAEWIWQKIQGQIQEQLNNAVADAVGEGEKASPDVDPFDFKGLEF
jgi:hypothetical protein